ncbi:complex I NDUFA9 subunit family protein [Roseateles oligotrophus]|uniref:Complex I NDUFA9 subunit family protein n=1 Tax=Roseateles oligotrophus TaxID=1769250 RepID=A0ABT2YHL7_9BURK|nr:complex I NDUFA9 subunit family protein [Roseateles oligotrophus]MCV2369549.1 complex I NDUFA9 subunit family protein [Roseateles oligotrophus]
MSTVNPNILILGGSGFIGRSLCEQLTRTLGGRARITVPTRRLPHAQAIQGLPGLTVLQADVHHPAQLRSLLAGHDLVINLIAILQGDAAGFERAHVTLPRSLAEACAATGVRRVIHVSALGVPDSGKPAASLYLRSKAAGEAVLRGADLDLTLLRPSVVFGAGDRFLNLFAKLQTLFPVLPLAGAKVKFQPVWVEDVAAAIVACVQDPNTAGQTFELAGPQVLSLADIARLAGQLSGHQRPILALPAPLAWAQALMMELLPGEPLMSRDNLASMRVANVASGLLPGLETLGIKPQSIAAVAPAYLGAGEGCAKLDAWRSKRN